MLTQNLRKLEADGIVVRKNMSDLVLHIEYELDECTREAVCALLDHLATWGAFNLANRETIKKIATVTPGQPAAKLHQAHLKEIQGKVQEEGT